MSYVCRVFVPSTGTTHAVRSDNIGRVLHDCLFAAARVGDGNGGGDNPAGGDEHEHEQPGPIGSAVPTCAAFFGVALSDAFAMIRRHLDIELQQQSQEDSLHGGVLFLTTYSQEEWRADVRQDKARWQSLFDASRREMHEDNFHGAPLLRLFRNVDIKHVPRPQHLFALLACLEPTVAQGNSTATAAVALANLRICTRKQQLPQSSLHSPPLLTRATPQTTLSLSSPPNLVILHGLSKWLVWDGVGLGELAACLSHALFFCNERMSELGLASKQRGQQDASQPSSLPPPGPSLVVLDAPVESSSLPAYNDGAEQGAGTGSSGSKDERPARVADARAVLEALALRFCDKIIEHDATASSLPFS